MLFRCVSMHAVDRGRIDANHAGASHAERTALKVAGTNGGLGTGGELRETGHIV